MNRKLILLILPLLALFACSPIDIEDFADDSKEAKASAYIQKLIEGEFEDIKNSFEPKLRPKITDGVLNQMKDLLGEEDPVEINLIGYFANTHNKEPTRYNLTYQYGYKDKWILVNVAFRTLENGRDEIFGMNVYNPMDRPLQEIHKFTFKEKGIIHYIFLAGCAFVPLFILCTLVAAVRTKFKKRKWLWIIFILIGIVQFSLNWTSGQIGFNLIYFQLFGAGALTASIYSPWILTFSLPIGAIVFWINRENLKKLEVQQDEHLYSGKTPPPLS